MKGREYHDDWQEMELLLNDAEARVLAMANDISRVRAMGRKLYEGVLQRPAPEFSPMSISRTRRIAS